MRAKTGKPFWKKKRFLLPVGAIILIGALANGENDEEVASVGVSTTASSTTAASGTSDQAPAGEPEGKENEIVEAEEEDVQTDDESEAANALRVVPESKDDGNGRLFFTSTITYRYADECPADGLTPDSLLDESIRLFNSEGEQLGLEPDYSPTFDRVVKDDITEGCAARFPVIAFVDQLSNEMLLNIGDSEYEMSIEQLLSGQGSGEDWVVEGPEVVAEVESGDDCDDYAPAFETLPGVTCEEIYQAARVVLAWFEGFERLTDEGLHIQIVVLCDRKSEVTYLPESTHIPALADALVGKLCPGDRSLIVPA